VVERGGEGRSGEARIPAPGVIGTKEEVVDEDEKEEEEDGLEAAGAAVDEGNRSRTPDLISGSGGVCSRSSPSSPDPPGMTSTRLEPRVAFAEAEGVALEWILLAAVLLRIRKGVVEVRSDAHSGRLCSNSSRLRVEGELTLKSSSRWSAGGVGGRDAQKSSSSSS
jgi:hypothetical protein